MLRRVQAEIKHLHKADLQIPFIFEIADMNTTETIPEFIDLNNNCLIVTFPFEGESILFRVEFPLDYPFSAPGITFANDISFMGIKDDRYIIDKWNPLFTLEMIILVMYSEIRSKIESRKPVNTGKDDDGDN